jgi:hypothetical protein
MDALIVSFDVKVIRFYDIFSLGITIYLHALQTIQNMYPGLIHKIVFVNSKS